MVVILYQEGCLDVAQKTASELVGAFADHVSILQIAAELASTWPGGSSWDDLLIVIYNGKEFPAAANKFIADYLQERPDTALLMATAIVQKAPFTIAKYETAAQ